MMRSIALEYERQHGYLTSKTRRNPAKRKSNAWLMDHIDSPEAWPEAILAAEVLEQETTLINHIALEGSILGETGTNPVEALYEIMGWTDSLTYPGSSVRFSARAREYIDRPWPDELPTHLWPKAPQHEPMF